jgi:hypothetical protein
MRTLLVGLSFLAVCRSGIAGTVQQRLVNDPTFKLYVAIFKVTQAPNGSITDVQLTPSVDVRWQHEHPKAPIASVKIDIPKRFVATAVKKIRAKHWPLYKHSDHPESFFTYYYYSPQLGERVIEDLHEPE